MLRLFFFLQNRELQIMRKLEHQNIVKLKYFFYSSGDKVGKTVRAAFLISFLSVKFCTAVNPRDVAPTGTLLSGQITSQALGQSYDRSYDCHSAVK